MSVGEARWVSLDRAAQRLGEIFHGRAGATLKVATTLTEEDGKEHPFRAARIELIEEMQAGRLPSRAHRWTETGAPNTFVGREKPIELEDGTTLLPADFWERQHAWDKLTYTPVAYLQTQADWRLLRFVSHRTVDGGRPGWADRWGFNIIDHGLKAWQWVRIAVGIEVDANALEGILSAYAVGSDVATSDMPKSPWRGYTAADELIVAEGVELYLSGRATSADNAAKQLAPKAVGGGNEQSRARRLAPKIRAALKRSEEKRGSE